MKMYKIICFFLALFALPSVASFAQAGKKADKDMKNWRYEIEGVAEGKEGTYVVKIWTYSKKPKIAIEQAKKNAVHAIVFQGFVGSGRVSGQPPLASSPGIEQEKADFFKSFFADGGSYMKYISVSNDGSIDPDDMLNVGKEYKIGVVVSVRKEMLKKDLIAAGIIQSLNNGF
jgi:hypothetical protein